VLCVRVRRVVLIAESQPYSQLYRTWIIRYGSTSVYVEGTFSRKVKGSRMYSDSGYTVVWNEAQLNTTSTLNTTATICTHEGITRVSINEPPYMIIALQPQPTHTAHASVVYYTRIELKYLSPSHRAIASQHTYDPQTNTRGGG